QGVAGGAWLRQAVWRKAAGTGDPGAHQEAAGRGAAVRQAGEGWLGEGHAEGRQTRLRDHRGAVAGAAEARRGWRRRGGPAGKSRLKKRHSPQRRRGRRDENLGALCVSAVKSFCGGAGMDSLDQLLLRRRVERLLAPWQRSDGPGVTIGVVRGREIVVH